MRIVFGLLIALAALATTPASAQVYPWCAEYNMRGGATNCGFSTLQQCEWALSGNGGFCRRNLFYTGPTVAKPRRAKKRS
jgi:hypothetical protein